MFFSIPVWLIDVADWSVRGALVLFLALFLVLFFLGKVPVSYNFRNLLVRWRITAMTGAIFVLVAALLVVMLAFVNGMYELTKGSAKPGNVVVLSDGAIDDVMSQLDDTEVRTIPERIHGMVNDVPRDQPAVLKDEQGHWLASWETYASAMQLLPTRTCPVCGHKVEFDRLNPRTLRLHDHGEPKCPGGGAELDTKGAQFRFLQVRGLLDPVIAGRVHELELLPGGQWFSEAGVDDDDRIQCVLGQGIAHEMGKDREKKSMEPGDLIRIRDRNWVVTGIMKSAGSTFDSEIWANQEKVASEFGKRGYTSGVLKTANDEIGRALAEDATKNFKTPAVSAKLESEYYERLNGTNLLFLVGSIVIVVIMAIGAIFGVMNAMFAAISQRTSDVGVLRILGYKRVHILISFFLESLLLALIGGVVGCAIGYLCNGWSATSMIGGGGGGRSIVFQMAVSPRILLFGLAFSLLMGALGGFIPALSAMRLKPLESMR